MISFYLYSKKSKAGSLIYGGVLFYISYSFVIYCFGVINDSDYEIEVNEGEKDLFTKLISESNRPVSIKVSEDDSGGGFIIKVHDPGHGVNAKGYFNEIPG